MLAHRGHFCKWILILCLCHFLFVSCTWNCNPKIILFAVSYLAVDITYWISSCKPCYILLQPFLAASCAPVTLSLVEIILFGWYLLFMFAMMADFVHNILQCPLVCLVYFNQINCLLFKDKEQLLHFSFTSSGTISPCMCGNLRLVFCVEL